MVYLFGAQLVSGRAAIPEALLLPGRHVLRFVVVSNLAIFGARHFFGRPLHDWPAIAAAVLGIVLAITLVSFAANNVMAQQAPAKGRRRA
jgi:mannose/fructose/N-acetylgalactosamine-specific phosphotransferase system component IIC